MVRQASEKLALALGKELEADSDKIDIFRYGLEIILGGLVKVISVVWLSYILGILDTTLICLASYIPIRHFGGGVHLSTYYRCLTVGLTMFLFLGKLATWNINSNLLLIMLVIIFLFGIYVTVRWAPAKSNSIKMVSVVKIKQKIKTFLFLILWGIGNIVFIRLTLLNYTLASLLGASVSLLFISPWGYWVIQTLDNIINKIQKGGLKND